MGCSLCPGTPQRTTLKFWQQDVDGRIGNLGWSKEEEGSQSQGEGGGEGIKGVGLVNVRQKGDQGQSRKNPQSPAP